MKNIKYFNLISFKKHLKNFLKVKKKISKKDF